MDVFIVDFFSDQKLTSFSPAYLNGLLPRKDEEIYFKETYYRVMSVFHDYDNKRVQVYVSKRGE